MVCPIRRPTSLHRVESDAHVMLIHQIFVAGNNGSHGSLVSSVKQSIGESLEPNLQVIQKFVVIDGRLCICGHDESLSSIAKNNFVEIGGFGKEMVIGIRLRQLISQVAVCLKLRRLFVLC
eukprot:scaffold4976_cov161-Amphora_coffeaeformis.AAC.13